MVDDRAPAGSHSATGSPDEDPYTHFYVGLLLGLAVIVGIAAFHWLPAVTAMDRLGSDTVQVVHAGGRPPAPAGVRLTLVDMQFDRDVAAGTELERITKAIQILANLGPRAILIDQEIIDTVKDPVREKFIAAVRQANLGRPPVEIVLVPVHAAVPGQDGAPPVLADSPVNEFRKEPRDPHVRFGSPLLYPDSDGVIRSVPATVPVAWPGKTTPEAETMPTLSARLSSSTPAGCPPVHTRPDPPADAVREIVFSIGTSPQSLPEGVSRIAEADLERADLETVVRCAVVLIGETGPSAWRDQHQTPLGQMPGVLIHANALLSPPRWTEASHGSWASRVVVAASAAGVVLVCFAAHHVFRRRGYAKGAADWLGVAVFAVVAAAAVPALRHPLEFGLFDAESIKLAMEVAAVIAASACFALQDRVGHDCAVKFRAGAPADHGVKEKDPIRNLVWLFTFIGFAIAFLLVLGVVWLLAGAVLLPYGLRVGSLMPVLAASLEALLKAGERVMSLLEAAVRAVLSWLSRFLLAAVMLGAVPARAVEQPHAARQAATQEQTGTARRSWSAFTALLFGSRPAQGPVSGAGRVFRGDGPEVALQWLSAVPVDGAMLPTGTEGLCIAWAGGSPPFVVALRARSGRGLGSVRATERVLYLRSFTMPAEPVVVAVTDAQQARLSATIAVAGAVAPSAPQDAPARAAMALFVDGGPAWRLEALRRLAALAPADSEAADAMAELRLTADAVPKP